MSNVTSVREFFQPQPIAFVLLGLMLIALGLFCVKVDIADSTMMGWVGVGLGAMCLIAFFFTKPKFWVRIGTAGAETNAIWSHDREWTRKVVEAINSAIVKRGCMNLQAVVRHHRANIQTSVRRGGCQAEPPRRRDQDVQDRRAF